MTMRKDEMSIERVRRLTDQAESVRTEFVAVPIKDLRIVLRICQSAKTQRVCRGGSLAYGPHQLTHRDGRALTTNEMPEALNAASDSAAPA